MDDKTRDELGVLHARINYLELMVSELLSRLPEDERVEIGVTVMNHSIKLQGDALNSTFPDSYLREAEKYAISQQADVSKRALARWRPCKG